MNPSWLLLVLASPLLSGPVDNCSSMLGSLSVELRIARALPADRRTTFTCPRHTDPLIGASRQRVLNALGTPDATGNADGRGSNLWSYHFSARGTDSGLAVGTPVLSFQFNDRLEVSAVYCERSR
jgi:hypothetical protein